MRVLLVDDHVLFGEALQGLVRSIDFVAEVDYVSSGKSALKVIQEKRFDVVLLDINLINETGFEIYDQLIAKDKDLKIIALTSHGDDWTINHALEKGFNGYLLKSDGRYEIECALLNISENELYISSQIDQLRLKKSDAIGHLTSREMEILKAVCEGLSTKQIAESLFISVKTVETHRSNLFHKLDVKNMNEMIRKAFSLNIIPLKE